jgi:hypothetical protein
MIRWGPILLVVLQIMQFAMYWLVNLIGLPWVLYMQQKKKR